MEYRYQKSNPQKRPHTCFSYCPSFAYMISPALDQQPYALVSLVSTGLMWPDPTAPQLHVFVITQTQYKVHA